MRLFVRDLGGRRLASEGADVGAVKQIYLRQGVPVEEQHLCLGGRPLVDGEHPEGVEGVVDETTLF